MPSLSSLTDRIRAEFDELPGLKVTFAQACRLWQADEAKCLAALEALVNEGFLRRSPSGAFIALPRPDHRTIKAGIPEPAAVVRCPHCHHLNDVGADRASRAGRRSAPYRCVACWRIVSRAVGGSQ